MSSPSERRRVSRSAVDERRDDERAQEPGSPATGPPTAGERSLSVAELMFLQRTAGNQRIARFVAGPPLSSASGRSIQRQKPPGDYTMKQGGNLRNEAHEVIRYLPEGTAVEVEDPGDRKTKFRAGLIANEHSWSLHTPSDRSFGRRAGPAHGWIVDDNLSPAPARRRPNADTDKEGSAASGVTFKEQVQLLVGLAQFLVKPPQKLMVHQYQQAARAWTTHPRALLTAIVGTVDAEGRFAAGIVDKLVAAQADPSKAQLLNKMIEDVMGNQMSVLGDSAARMTSTNWVATVRDSSNYLHEFPTYFAEETKPPEGEQAKTGREFFLGEGAY